MWLRSHHCSLCNGASYGDEWVCWCPANYYRAFPQVHVEEQPAPAVQPIIRQIIVDPQYFPQVPLPMVAQTTGASIGGTIPNHGDLRGSLPDNADGRFNVVIDTRTGRIDITGNPTMLAILQPPMPPVDPWPHFDDDGGHDDSTEQCA